MTTSLINGWFRFLCNALLVWTIALAAASCTSAYKPSVWPSFEPITEFSSTGSVNLRNAQSNDELFTVASQAGSKWETNLKACTETAVATTARELAKRGMQISNSSSKWISMSITSIYTDMGMTRTDTSVKMSVVTGSGYAAEYEGKNSSVMTGSRFIIPRQPDGGIMRVVVEMLKDAEIVAYLKN